MVSSLSKLVNNLSEGIHRIKSKYGNDARKCETCGIKYKYCDCFFEYMNFKDNLIVKNVYVGTKTINKSLMEN